LLAEKIELDDVCFVGDDIIDLGPLTRAGLAVAVGDGVAEAKAAAHYVTQKTPAVAARCAKRWN
jgi:3-deoxy-D-manno-octulosonate 8-phosphate phosphatase (KDO 8-P phosphatase)